MTDQIKDKDQEAREEQARVFKARVGDYLETFTTAAGKRTLKDMRISYCGHIEAGDDEALGKRNVVKDIEALLISAKNPQLIDDLFRRPEDESWSDLF